MMKSKKLLLLTMLSVALQFPANAQLGKLKSMMGKKEKNQTQSPSNQTSEKEKDQKVDQSEKSSDQSKTSTPAWSYVFEQNIDWFRLSPTGKMIASTNDGLYGLEPASGKVAWKHPQLKNLTKENYNPIEGSPFIAIVTGGMMNMQQIILDVTDGRIVADTKALGMKMVNKRYAVPALGGVIFSGFLNNSPSIVLVDLDSGKKKWVLDNIFESASETLVAKPLSISDQSLLLATTKRLYCIDVSKGSVIWKTDFKTSTTDGFLATEVQIEVTDNESSKSGEKKGGLMGSLGGLGKVPGLGAVGKVAGSANTVGKVGAFGSGMKDAAAAAADGTYGKFLLIDQYPNLVYYYNNNSMGSYDINTGEEKWNPVKFSDPVSQVLFDKRGFLISTDDKQSELMLLDYQSGIQKWKPISLRGRISALKLQDSKLAVASAKESGNNFVNIIDLNNGTSASKSEMKVSGNILDIKQNSKGLIYRTDREMNIQDIQSGKDIWPKSLSYKQGGIGVDKGEQSYFWANSQLYTINNTTGEYRELGKKLNFGGDENPTSIELREKGILISSAQNMALFDFQGELIYHVYHQAPGTSLANKILNITAMAVSMSQSAANGYQAGLSGPNTVSYNSHMEKSDRWANIGGSALDDMKKRFTATQDSKNYKVILTDIKGEQEGYGLIRINKDTGKNEATVVLADKKPDYISDDTANLIFYKNGKKEIMGYKL
jgi:outer membrane protein assembly factor BamB